MAAILYRGLGTWHVFDDAEVEAALADGWYVLTPAGHPAPPESESKPEDAPEPAVKRRGRPPKQV